LLEEKAEDGLRDFSEVFWKVTDMVMALEVSESLRAQMALSQQNIERNENSDRLQMQQNKILERLEESSLQRGGGEDQGRPAGDHGS
jgi:hypothetical protein